MSFEVFGYSIDYLVDSKYKGSISVSLDERNDRLLGYEGRERFVLEEDITLDNKRVLKKGTNVTTEMIALQGKLKKD